MSVRFEYPKEKTTLDKTALMKALLLMDEFYNKHKHSEISNDLDLIYSHLRTATGYTLYRELRKYDEVKNLK